MDEFDVIIHEDGSKSCKMCRGCSFRDEPFTVITHMGKTVSVPFYYCPVCGRRLLEET